MLPTFEEVLQVECAQKRKLQPLGGNVFGSTNPAFFALWGFSLKPLPSDIQQFQF